MCKSRAAHRALITCNMSCAAWYEGTAQLFCFTEYKSHSFEFYLIINREREEGSGGGGVKGGGGGGIWSRPTGFIRQLNQPI